MAIYKGSTPLQPAVSVESEFAKLADLGAEAGYELHARLNQGGEYTILVLSDSTADDATKWPKLFASQFATDFTGTSVNYLDFNHSTLSWESAEAISTGTGDSVLNIANAAVSGKFINYHASVAGSICDGINADMFIISVGHNQGTSVVNDANDLDATILVSVSRFLETYPNAVVCISTQNPRLDAEETNHLFRSSRIRKMAAKYSYGLIDADSAFRETGDIASLLNADNLHPNSAGSQLWSDTVYKTLAPCKKPLRTRTNILETAQRAVADVSIVPVVANTSFGNWVKNAYVTEISENTTYTTDKRGFSVKLSCDGTNIAYLTRTLSGGILEQFIAKKMTIGMLYRFYISAGSNTNSGRGNIYVGSRSVDGRSITPEIAASGGWVTNCLMYTFRGDETTLRLAFYVTSQIGVAQTIYLDDMHLFTGTSPCLTA